MVKVPVPLQPEPVRLYEPEIVLPLKAPFMVSVLTLPRLGALSMLKVRIFATVPLVKLPFKVKVAVEEATVGKQEPPEVKVNFEAETVLVPVLA
jgi:hypothetical protein